IQRQLLQVVLTIFYTFATLKAVGVLLNVDSPIVVVLSESPAFGRGDLLFLALTSAPLNVGDITVYKIKGQPIPIVHRILEIHEETETGKVKLLTKGDYNAVDDRGLYNKGQVWIEPEDVVGKAYAYVPYLGLASICWNDYPEAKILILLVGIYLVRSNSSYLTTLAAIYTILSTAQFAYN
ncbi:Signal peptidase complex catalytic subunit S11A, partial [Terramyces sp. JEL0728]